MLRNVILAVALSLATPALAVGPIGVTTGGFGPISDADPFKTSLESIGVGRFLFEADVGQGPIELVNIFSSTRLSFHLLENRAGADGGPLVTSLIVDGTASALPLQSFTAPGTLLGVPELSGSFNDLIAFTIPSVADDFGIPWPEFVTAYIRTADGALISGQDGIEIGNLSRLYFSIDNAALIEVSAVPEPASWTLLIAGFGLAGRALRTVRRTSAA